MKLIIRSNRMEEVEGLRSEYPYVFHHVDLRQTMVPWHWHEALEFGYVVQGSVTVSTTERNETFSQGEGFFINSNALTSMTHNGGCIIDSHLFDPVFLSGHYKSIFESKYISPVVQNRSLDLLPIRGQTTQQNHLLGKLRQLSKLQSHPDTEFETRNLLSEIWLLLLQVLENTQVPSTPTGNQDRLLLMLAFIQENYYRKLTLDEIADAASISQRECLRCFQNAIHQSPMEYLAEYRVRCAMKLLETTNLSITEIAQRTGWNHNSYFAKVFSRICGKTPGEYRKTCSNKTQNL